MRTLSVAQAEAQLEAMLNHENGLNGPVRIEGPQQRAVLVPEALWRGVQESLVLVSNPGMAESRRLGMNLPIEECEGSPVW
jgi:PHD/YefM family antitoxin component YafN of YafNO toxin-antitoxin module